MHIWEKRIEESVNTRINKYSVDSKRSKNCSECPFKANSVMISCRVAGKPMTVKDIFGVDFGKYIKHLIAAVRKSDKPFSCHMDHQHQCAGAARFQPLVVLPTDYYTETK